MIVEERLRAWGAEPTREVRRTASSDLAEGVRQGEPVVLKVARIEEERRGGRLMAWWSRHGGLPVLEADDDAILMRRAGRSLLDLPADEADRVLLETALALHAMPSPPASVALVPLRTWFHDLVDEPQTDPVLAAAASIARDLLAEAGPSVALHGDLHHGNVLELDGQWVAIDPKGLIGAPEFDLANLFCNPTEEVAGARLDGRLGRAAEVAGVDRDRLRAWVLAWCGLSLAWSSDESDEHARAARLVASRLLH